MKSLCCVHTARRNYVKCVEGESLYISLEGIDLADAELSFFGESGNFTLVTRMDVWMDGWIVMMGGEG